MSSRMVISGGGADAVVQAAQIASLLAVQLESTVEAVIVGTEPLQDGSQILSDLTGLVDRVHFFQAPEEVALTGAALADALQQVAGEDVAAMVLGDHHFSREAAARVALRLGAPCLSMCEALTIDGGGVRVERGVYGGVATGIFSLEGSPPVCVLAPGVSGEPDAASEVPPEVVVAELTLTDGARSIGKVVEEQLPRTVDLADARRVVSVGRGFVKAEDLALAEELAAALSGELGCSRPIAEDFKWLPQERLVGLTGASISADLYLALGISGQVQHLAGIKGAKVVAAVNNDPKSPMARNADYIVVGDLYKVVPALLDEIRSRGSGS
jgi:electron transfer flavoprotein alpha subunit